MLTAWGLVFLLINPLVMKKSGMKACKPPTGGGLFLMVDISPVMSASIPAGSALAFLTWSAFHGSNLSQRDLGPELP
jgi:hypothetical protein